MSNQKGQSLPLQSINKSVYFPTLAAFMFCLNTVCYIHIYAKENYREMLNDGFLDNKVLKIL